MSRNGFRCFECDEKAHHAHHVVPLVRGGKKTIPLCTDCHEKVHDLNFEDHSRLTKEGIERARAAGVKLGRPKANVCETTMMLLSSKLPIRKVAEIMGVSERTIKRRKRRYKLANPEEV